jgi:hypothetical protein
VLAVVMASGVPATAHHSKPLYFDTNNAMTLEGEVVRVVWSDPHILLFLQSKNEKGEPETWVLQGATVANANRRAGLKERLQPGISISARAWPPRIPLLLNEAQKVLMTGPDDARASSRIVGGGQIRFSKGDVMTFGAGPTF